MIDSNILLKVSKSLKIEIGDFIDKGKYGFVYSIPDNKVIKLSYKRTNNIDKLIKENLNLYAKIFDCGEIKIDNKLIYYTIMESVEVNEEITNKIDECTRIIFSAYLLSKKLDSDQKNFEKIDPILLKQNYNKIIEYIPNYPRNVLDEYYKNSDSELKNSYLSFIKKHYFDYHQTCVDLFKIIDEIKQTNICFNDFHSKNFGLNKKNKLIGFDLIKPEKDS